MAPRSLGALLLPFCSLVASALTPQQDPDRDGDGLSDFQELRKYRTDPTKADTDGDGIPDGDWRERREYQYTVRLVVQVMRPVTPEFLCDDYQDVRVLDETADHVELEVILYPFNTVGEGIGGDAAWRAKAVAMPQWTAPGPTADWTPTMKEALEAAMRADGIDATRLDDKAIVEAAAPWLCNRTKNSNCFTAFATAFDDRGQPFVPPELLPAVPGAKDPDAMREQWSRDLSARGMFEHKTRGSCSSSSIYINGCLRALGVPTRIVLCIPVVDAGDDDELRMLDRGITHRELRRDLLGAVRPLRNSWSSHSFNEVFVDGRWRRLNYGRLGQDIRDPDLFGLMVHVATFSDWADARMPETLGRRQTLRISDDAFGHANPYSTISLRDEFGPHCALPNPEPAPYALRITDAQWGDAAAVAADVRKWFADHGVFGLVVKVDGVARGSELMRFLALADLSLQLLAEAAPPLNVGVDADNWWLRPDGRAFLVVPLGPADREKMRRGAPYRLVARNGEKNATWQVAESLRIARQE
ncbi:MAG: hypothetical protein U1E73_01000 [Planctomycetota bacterium]